MSKKEPFLCTPNQGCRARGGKHPTASLPTALPLWPDREAGASGAGSRVPCSVPRGWIAGNLARKMLPRGQAIPALRARSSARATAGPRLRAPSQLLPNGIKFTAGSSRRYVQGHLPSATS